MAELLARDLQRLLLERLHGAYPEKIRFQELLDISDERNLKVNLMYLDEHGLVEATLVTGGLNHQTMIRFAKITATGIDFLTDDGGLSAILGVVTVKLHEDTVKELIALKIDQSNLPESEKKKFRQALRELPGEATKHLVLKLVDAGLENWPKVIPMLQALVPG